MREWRRGTEKLGEERETETEMETEIEKERWRQREREKERRNRSTDAVRLRIIQTHYHKASVRHHPPPPPTGLRDTVMNQGYVYLLKRNSIKFLLPSTMKYSTRSRASN